MRTTERAQGPALSFGTPLVVLLVAVSLLIAVGSWGSVWLPESDGTAWSSLRRGLRAEEPRSFPFWWLTVVFVLAALAAWAQGSWRSRQGGRVPAGAWWILSAAMAWISLDHALALHEVARKWTSGWPPGVLGQYPVEVLLVLGVAPAAVVAIATAVTRRQQALLVLAAVAYCVGEVIVGKAFIDLPLAEPRTQLVESLLQWTGAILLLAAAGRGCQERRSGR